MTLRGPDGVIDERRVVLADARKMQEVEVDGHGVTRVTLRILSTYAGQKGTAASLAEVGFFEKEARLPAGVVDRVMTCLVWR